MPPFRTLRRLLSRANEDWRETVQSLFTPAKPPTGPRPLRVMRLERRRVLSADFSIAGSALVLDGFDDADSISISQSADQYLFTTNDGWNAPAETPAGITVDGDTLAVSREVLDGLSGGIAILGDAQSSLDVTLGNVDFSGLDGALTVVAPTTLGQQPFALFTAPTDGLRLAVAPSGLEIGTNINLAGDLELFTFGAITDAEGTQIRVTGNASFTSSVDLATDFNSDGVVDDADRLVWRENFGLATGATKANGDANGDGMVNAIDYTAWQDTEGQVAGVGGIVLADKPSDRLEITGSVTFDAVEDVPFDVEIGISRDESGAIDPNGDGGWVELGDITAFGTNVLISEDANSTLQRIEADNFHLTADGTITTTADATILVEEDATFTSLFRDYQADFNDDGLVNEADDAIWQANFEILAGATKSQGDANGDGRVDAADHVIWRDEFTEFSLLTPLEMEGRGGITIGSGATINVGNLATFDAIVDDGTDPEQRFDILVDPGAMATFGSVSAGGASVKIVEDAGGTADGTVLAGIDALQFLLATDGPITVQAGTDIVVRDGGEIAPDATFASSADITLADSTDSDLAIDGVVSFISTGGSVRVGVDAAGAASDANFVAGSLRFSAADEARIAEDAGGTADGTEIATWEGYVIDACLVDLVTVAPTTNNADLLELLSEGPITDAPSAVINIRGDASFVVSSTASLVDAPATAIVLANDDEVDTLNNLQVDGAASFVVLADGAYGVDVGVGDAGAPALAAFNADDGARFFAADSLVRIAEDSASNLSGWTSAQIDVIPVSELPTESQAATLELLAEGTIADDADAVTTITDDATFVVSGEAGAIVLADGTTDNTLSVTDAATFIVLPTTDAVGGIEIGVNSGVAADALFNAGRIRFSATGETVKIAEDSDTVLADWETGTLQIDVLGTNAEPVASAAETLELLSAGTITDQAEAVVNISGDATLFAEGSITLADVTRIIDGLTQEPIGELNVFTVGDLATFIAGSGADAGQSIDIGVNAFDSKAEANFAAGRVRFSAINDTVRIAEDDSMALAGWTADAVATLVPVVNPLASEAQTLELATAGDLTDAADAVVLVTRRDGNGDRRFDAAANGTFAAMGSITLADGPTAGNDLSVDGRATFIASDGAPAGGETIDVGVGAAGAPADAEFVAGRLRFLAPDGLVRIAEDASVTVARPEAVSETWADAPGTVLTGWAPGSVSSLAMSTTLDANRADTLEVFSYGRITDAPDSLGDGFTEAVTTINDDATFVVSDESNVSTRSPAIALADGTNANALTVGDAATFIVLPTTGAVSGIEVGVGSSVAADAAFNAGRVRFSAVGQTVKIAEDSDTVLADWEVNALQIDVLGTTAEPAFSATQNLELLSTGMITDQAETVVSIGGDATLFAEGSITLADEGGLNLFNVGDLATFIAGSETDAGQSIDLGVASDGSKAEAIFNAFTAGRVRFSAINDTVRIAEDDSMDLAGWTADAVATLVPVVNPLASEAQTLELATAGDLTDAADAVVLVTSRDATGDRAFDTSANASFAARGSITLADGATVGNDLSIDGRATFVVSDGVSTTATESIDVGVDDEGSQATAEFVAGRLRFLAPDGVVRIAEDASLTVARPGDVTQIWTDAPGTALTGWAPGSVSSLVMSTTLDANRAETLEVFSVGAITDAPDGSTETITNIADDAAFVVSTDADIADGDQAIVLADGGTANALTVGDLATFIVGDAVSPIAAADRGSDAGIHLGVDATGAGADATFTAGRLRFFAPLAVVEIYEDAGGAAGTVIASWDEGVTALDDTLTPEINETRVLGVVSDGAITDEANTEIEITGRLPDVGGEADPDLGATATFIVSEKAQIADAVGDARVAAIILANAGSTNRLEVDSHVQFIVETPLPGSPGFEGPKGIDVGVSDAGRPADATFNAGSLQFYAPGGRVRIAEDSSTQIGFAMSASQSETEDLRLQAKGEITDAEDAATTVAQSAELNAMDGEADIELGDEDATFTLAAAGDAGPALFDAVRYLAMQASNVSVQVDSAVNVRHAGDIATSDDSAFRNVAGDTFDTDFGGVYFLTAAGSISQVSDSDGSGITTLTAGQMALISQGVVMMTALAFTRQGTTPNLQVSAAGTVDLLDAGGTAAGTVKGQYPNRAIPSSQDSRLAPVLVEADDPTTGDRGVQPTRPFDPSQPDGQQANREQLLLAGLLDNEIDDVIVPDGSGSRGSLVSERTADGSGFENAQTQEATRIDDLYSAIAYVEGSVIVGDVADALGNVVDQSDARGFVVTANGNSFLESSGDITFTSAGREDGNVFSADVVSMSGGVFTAVAAGSVAIATDQPDAAAGLTTRTTRLASATGVVTSVGTTTADGGTSPVQLDADNGPRVLLDTPDDGNNAATTALVTADTSFEQRITLALGSRGEENLLVEVEWADVANVRENGPNNGLARDVFPDSPQLDADDLLRESYSQASVPGSNAFADVTQTRVVDIETPINERPDGTEPRLIYQDLGPDADGANDFRVATIRHNYNVEFIPNNPFIDPRSGRSDRSVLPTTIRVYNDPAINLFEGAASNDNPSDLNSAAIAIVANVFAAPQAGFFLLSAPDTPRDYVSGEMVSLAEDPLPSAQQTTGDAGRAAVASTAETIEYGRVDERGEWIDDIPGEAWPQVREDVEGDYLREIRDKVDEGPYSEGRYRILLKTPRGEQLLEEWVKGDPSERLEGIGPEVGEAEPDEAESLEAPAPERQEVIPLDEAIAEPAELLPLSATEAMAPAGVAMAAQRFSPAGEATTEDATGAAFAAMAAVGAWSRRLGDAGAFRLDADGVAFTRMKRRQRQRGD